MIHCLRLSLDFPFVRKNGERLWGETFPKGALERYHTEKEALTFSVYTVAGAVSEFNELLQGQTTGSNSHILLRKREEEDQREIERDPSWLGANYGFGTCMWVKSADYYFFDQ